MSDIVTVEVGGIRIRTFVSTLNKSPKLRQIFSGNGNNERQKDGSYFLDMDFDIFEQLLSYMRQPTVYPLLWDPHSGFDYGLYNKIQATADQYGLYDLRDWIRNQHYVGAIKQTVKGPMRLEPTPSTPGFVPIYTKVGTAAFDVNVKQFNRTRFACPREDPHHMVEKGEELQCDSVCRDCPEFDMDKYLVENYTAAMFVEKETSFNNAVCMKQ
jgi:hypothetical protein